jgi:hypothetical protein
MRLLAAQLGLGACLVAGVLFTLASPLGLLVFIPYGGMGYLLVIRRPRNLVGWLLIAIAVGGGISVPAVRPWSAEILEGRAAGWVPFFVLLQRLLGVAGNGALVALLATTFPTGRWPRGDVGRVSAVGLGLIGVLVPLQALAPTLRSDVFRPSEAQPVMIANPIGIAPGWPGWEQLDPSGGVGLLSVVGLALCVLGFIVRFRRSTGTERLQDKWLAGSLAFFVVSTTWGLALVVAVGADAAAKMDATTYAIASVVAWGPASVALPLVPIAVGIAVLRYHLYEIDRIISRTVAYAVLTAMLVGVYAAGFVLMQLVLATFTKGGGPIAVAASTLVVFALFQPLRRRIQAAMDRRFNRSRYDTQRTVEAFAVRLRDEIDLTRLRVALVDSVEDAVRPVSATVWLRAGSGGR